MTIWGRALVCGIVSLAAHAALICPASAKDGFPGKQVHLVVAFPPGGGQDLVARVLAAKLGAALDQTVIVEDQGSCRCKTGVPRRFGQAGTQTSSQFWPNRYFLIPIHTPSLPVFHKLVHRCGNRMSTD